MIMVDRNQERDWPGRPGYLAGRLREGRSASSCFSISKPLSAHSRISRSVQRR